MSIVHMLRASQVLWMLCCNRPPGPEAANYSQGARTASDAPPLGRWGMTGCRLGRLGMTGCRLGMTLVSVGSVGHDKLSVGHDAGCPVVPCKLHGAPRPQNCDGQLDLCTPGTKPEPDGNDRVAPQHGYPPEVTRGECAGLPLPPAILRTVPGHCSKSPADRLNQVRPCGGRGGPGAWAHGTAPGMA